MLNKKVRNMTTQQVVPKQNTPNNKRLITGLILVSILLLGLVLRISYLWEIANDPGFRFPPMDGGFHDYWARGLATGDWTVVENLYDFQDPEICTSPYFRPPAYPFFLAVTYSISNCSYLAARIVQMGVGLLSCVLAYFLGKGVFGRIYWAFIYFEGELLAPVLLVLLGLLLMHVLRLWYDRPSPGRAFAAGASLGLFALARANVLLFGPVALGWFWWVMRRKNGSKGITASWLGFIFGAAVVIAPVTIRNYIVAKDFILITSNAGINFYISNNEKSTGFTPAIPALEEITYLGRSGWRSSDYPKMVRGVEALEGKKMKHSKVSSYFARKAIDYIREHPGRILKLMVIKTALFWGPAEVSNNKEIQYEKQNSLTLRYLPGFPIAISFAVVGLAHLFLGRKKRHRQNEDILTVTQRQFEMSVLILLFIFAYFISFLPFFVAGRYRVPIIPFLLLFGAYGLYRTGRLVISRDLYDGGAWLVIYIALYMMASRPIVLYKPDLAKWHNDRAAHYRLAGQLDLAVEECRKAIKIRPNYTYAHNNLGTVLQLQGKLDEAIDHFRRSLEFSPNANAHYNLGNMLRSQGKLRKAISHYNQALQLEPNHASTHNVLGFMFGSQGNLDEAIGHFRQALQAKPDYAEARYNLGNALRLQGKLDEAIKHYTEALHIVKDRPEIYYHMALVYDLQGKFDMAIQNYNEALRLKPDWVMPMNTLARLLATHKGSKVHNSQKATLLAERACELTNYKQPELLDTLAVAYAAAGKFPKAIETAEKALQLAESLEQKELAEKIRNRLQLYQAGQPHRKK